MEEDQIGETDESLRSINSIDFIDFIEICEKQIDSPTWSSHCFLFLQLLRCFTSLGALRTSVTSRVIRHYSDRVSPFGNLRIKGCSPPPRSISPARRVLHRLSKPRHPPYALFRTPTRRGGNRKIVFPHMLFVIFRIHLSNNIHLRRSDVLPEIGAPTETSGFSTLARPLL